MISRIPCNCGSLINIDSEKEDKSGWLMYKITTENGLRDRGLCPKCQAGIKCYLDNNPIDVKNAEPKKRGRPPKKEKEEK